MTPQLKIVVEKHSDGYVAYPLCLARGTVVGQGDSYEEALADDYGTDDLSPNCDRQAFPRLP